MGSSASLELGFSALFAGRLSSTGFGGKPALLACLQAHRLAPRVHRERCRLKKRHGRGDGGRRGRLRQHKSKKLVEAHEGHQKQIPDHNDQDQAHRQVSTVVSAKRIMGFADSWRPYAV